ncbi:MAG: hypothetical protein WA814_08590 [Candidatus Baltobacteraceae bacterium]
MKSFARARIFSATLAAIAVSGCASQSNATMPQLNAPSSIVLPQAGPPACKGQKNTKTYSSAVETLSNKDGALCIPSFHGLGGTLEYPGAKPSGKVTVTSTTIDNGFPYPGTGTAVFYMEIALPAATSFGKTLHAGSGLTGKQIKSKADYTVFLSYFKYGFWYAGSSCYTTATPGKYGGVLGHLASVLKGQSFAGPYTILLEVYPNQQSTTTC